MSKFKDQLQITTAVAGAIVLASCNRPASDAWTDQPTAICTDGQARRIADDNCGRGSPGMAHGGGGGWYYLNRGGYVPPEGERVNGGSYTGVAGTRYTTAGTAVAASISRGGFGSSAHGGGGGE